MDEEQPWDSASAGECLVGRAFPWHHSCFVTFFDLKSFAQVSYYLPKMVQSLRWQRFSFPHPERKGTKHPPPAFDARTLQ